MLFCENSQPFFENHIQFLAENKLKNLSFSQKKAEFYAQIHRTKRKFKPKIQLSFTITLSKSLK